MSLTLLQLFLSVVFLRTSMPMTPRFTARARRLTFILSSSKFLSVSTTSPAGCDVIGCSWTLGRPSCSGARPIDSGIDYWLLPWRLAVLPVSTIPDLGIFLDCHPLMRTHMCAALSRTASPCCVSCAASVTLSLRQSSSRSSLLWSFAVWTVVTVRWLVFRSSGLPSMTPRVHSERSRSFHIPTSPLRPHHLCTSQFTLATCAQSHNIQGCHPDVPCSDQRRTTVSAAIRPCCWRPFSPQTPVLYFWRPDCPGCSTDLHQLSCFSGSRSLHLENATTAHHLCLIVDCI